MTAPCSAKLGPLEASPSAAECVARTAILPTVRANLHFLIVGLATLSVVPLLIHFGLPLVWPWESVAGFARAILIQSSCAASVLYVISRPEELAVVAARYRNPGLAAAVAVLCLALFMVFGIKISTLFKVITVIAGLELAERVRERPEALKRSALAIVLPGCYVLFGFVLVFTYNNIIASARFYGAYDPTLNHWDARLMGTTVSTVAHHAAAILPTFAFRLADLLYFLMFAQIGATILICGFTSGRRSAFEFAGAILMVQALALLLFYIWPSHGPYYTCTNHFGRLGPMSDLGSYLQQRIALDSAHRLWAHQPVRYLGLNYYLSFPCTHISQPLVALWFLRRWKRAVALLLIHDVLLVWAIVVLEWHYFVDFIGGIAIAVVVIWMMFDAPPARWDDKGSNSSATCQRRYRPLRAS